MKDLLFLPLEALYGFHAGFHRPLYNRIYRIYQTLRNFQNRAGGNCFGHQRLPLP